MLSLTSKQTNLPYLKILLKKRIQNSNILHLNYLCSVFCKILLINARDIIALSSLVMQNNHIHALTHHIENKKIMIL